MTTRLVDAGWSQEIEEAFHDDSSELRIISSFIKAGAPARLLAAKPKTVLTIARFNFADFAERLSETAALRRSRDYREPGKSHEMARTFRLDRFATVQLLDEEGTGSHHNFH